MSDANQRQNLVQFTLGDAQRIGHAVQQVERGRRGRKPSSLPRAAGGGGGGGVSLIQASYSGAWARGQTKHVNVAANVLGTSATTVSVLNTLGQIMPGGVRTCYVLRPAEEEGGDWMLVNAEC